MLIHPALLRILMIIPIMILISILILLTPLVVTTTIMLISILTVSGTNNDNTIDGDNDNKSSMQLRLSKQAHRSAHKSEELVC